MSRTPAGQDADSERLPWLEPYRDNAGKPRAATRPVAHEKKPNRSPWLAIGAVVALTAAVGGGYWLGQRGTVSDQSSAPEVRVAERVPLPGPGPKVADPAVTEALPPVTEPAVEPAPVPKVEAAKPAARAKPPVRKAKRKVKASPGRTQYERVIAKQREAARTWPKMPSPGPAGQVIQLGAFSTRARAQNAYRERLARYPVLSGMPQVVVPVITQPRGEILYVLRLGTQSREQSDVVCRNLRTSGDHCLVIG